MNGFGSTVAGGRWRNNGIFPLPFALNLAPLIDYILRACVIPTNRKLAVRCYLDEHHFCGIYEAALIAANIQVHWSFSALGEPLHFG